MTSFQRLLKGLTVLNRYSGITEARAATHTYEAGVQYDLTHARGHLAVPVPTTVNLDARDVQTLERAGWSREQDGWRFAS